MGKEFKAKRIDMDLVLTTMSGEEISLSPKSPMTTDESIRIMKEWTRAEEVTEEGFDKVKLLSTELASVYPKPSEWWLSNFDIATLSDIVVFVAEAIGGVQKKELSSN